MGCGHNANVHLLPSVFLMSDVFMHVCKCMSILYYYYICGHMFSPFIIQHHNINIAYTHYMLLSWVYAFMIMMMMMMNWILTDFTQCKLSINRIQRWWPICLASRHGIVSHTITGPHVITNNHNKCSSHIIRSANNNNLLLSFSNSLIEKFHLIKSFNTYSAKFDYRYVIWTLE